MKKFKMFFSIVLLMVLTLSSCGKKEEIENVNSVSTWTENSENKEALEEVNSEVDKVIGEIENTIENTWSNEKSWNTEVSTGKTNIGEFKNTSFTWESKLIKLSKNYVSPGWNDEVAFSVKVSWDKIENVSVEMVKWDETSEKIIKSFRDSINTSIVWKTIEEAKNISTVWWASLTTNAFKAALKNM